MITKQFVTAGRATFTLDIPEHFVPLHDECKLHYTYRVTSKKDDQRGFIYFVSLLTGPNNTRDYTYMGLLNPANGRVKLTAKSKVTDKSWSLRLLRRALACVWADQGEDITKHGFELMHEGRCGRCGRPLTRPESIEIGLGPVCIKS